MDNSGVLKDRDPDMLKPISISALVWYHQLGLHRPTDGKPKLAHRPLSERFF